jgi:Transposase DDE domain/Transposase domain (DUF772)
MKLTLRQQLAQFGHLLQSKLFPVLEEELGELSATARRLIAVLNLIPLQRFIPSSRGWMGRPSKDRVAIARAFVAKAVYNFENTRDLLDRLASDRQLLAICGWKYPRQLPHESTFSRAFAEFAQMELPQFVHEAFIRETHKDRLVGHIVRDSTAIEGREQVAPEAKKARENRKNKAPKKRRKPGPRRAGDPVVEKEKTRLERQRGMSLAEMLQELPCHCDIGCKKNSDGRPQYWRGYKLHLDVADGQIPIAAVLSSASLHDSQVAIPLATLTGQRVTSLYDVMDAAYDARQIHEHSRSLGHVPIIDPAQRVGPRRSVIGPFKAPRQFSPAEQKRFRERTMVERVNGRLKEEFGAGCVRVRGAAKVMAHLMFGVLALTADQLLRLGEGCSG